MRKIFVAGNPLVEQDSLALEVARELEGKLKGIGFEEIEDVEGLEKEKDLYIMDVAFGIKKVEIVTDLEKLETVNAVSGHDIDLAMELKLLQKIGRLGKVHIIAVPANYTVERAVREAEQLLKRISP